MLFDPAQMHGLKIHEVINLLEYYEACCTAEFIIENCKSLLSEEEALKIGYEVRRRMRKADVCDGQSERDFISDVLC